jgi:hypothetical protein
VKGGRDDLGKKQYDEAVKKLEKARGEDPTLLEACYWLGVVHEARKDARAALVAYKAFKAAYDEKRAAGAASKDEDALFEKTQARLDVLAASETELSRIRDGYVDRLYAFAEENFVRDPAVTARALKMLLDVRPKHERARRLLEKLGTAEAASAAADTDPFGVRAWQDLIATKAFSENNEIEYVDDLMVMERHVGQIVHPPRLEKTTPRYVIDVEARFTVDHGNRVFGVSFGKADQHAFCVMITPNKCDLVEIRDAGASSQTFESAPLKSNIEVEAWHRVTLVVDGLHLEVQMDGKKAVEATVKGYADLDGDVGVYVQESRVEFRRFRVGRRA